MLAIVADGGPDAGLGHLGRCSAIAVALRTRGVEVAARAYGAREARTIDGVEWLPLDASPPGAVLLLDSYTLAADARAALGAGRRVAVFHDHAAASADAALVIDVAGDEEPPGRAGANARGLAGADPRHASPRAGADPRHGPPGGGARGAAGERSRHPPPERTGAGPLVLAGLRHAPLRPLYWGLPERQPRARVERVLVTTGGGTLAPAGAQLAAALRAALPDATVALVRGPLSTLEPPPGVELVDAPASLLSELLAADLVVTAAGQTALEAAATGAATLAVPLVDNQRRQAAALASAGAAAVVEPGDVVAAVTALAADPARRAELARRGQAAVDGFGALRIAFRLAALCDEPHVR